MGSVSRRWFSAACDDNRRAPLSIAAEARDRDPEVLDEIAAIETQDDRTFDLAADGPIETTGRFAVPRDRNLLLIPAEQVGAIADLLPDASPLRSRSSKIAGSHAGSRSGLENACRGRLCFSRHADVRHAGCGMIRSRGVWLRDNVPQPNALPLLPRLQSTQSSLRADAMFFFIPVRTDAPIYHFPWATIGLIVANVLAFALGGGFGSGERHEMIWQTYALTGGDWRLMHWVTAHFIHVDFLHLFGNMIFLWTFGLVVEGKIGASWFLLLCGAVAVASAMICQAVMLLAGDTIPCGGASIIVSSLLPIAFLWAPKNDIGLFYFFWIFFVVRAGVLEVSVKTFTMVVIALDIVSLGLADFGISTPLAHLIGVGFGIAVGVWMLKTNRVDCEGWDYFSVERQEHFGVTRREQAASVAVVDRSLGPSSETRDRIAKRVAEKKKGRRKVRPLEPLEPLAPQLLADELDEDASVDELPESLTPPKRTTPPRRSEQRSSSSQPSSSQPSSDPASSDRASNRPKPTTLRELLDAGRFKSAYRKLRSKRSRNPKFTLPASDLLALALGLKKKNQPDEAVGLLEEVLAIQPDRDDVRFVLASLLLKSQNRPQAALDQIGLIDTSDLSPKQAERVAALESLATEKANEGAIELRGRSWS